MIRSPYFRINPFSRVSGPARRLPSIALLTILSLVSLAFPQDTAVSNEKIHLGDLVDIDVVGSTEFDWRGRLSPEGFLPGLRFTESPVYALCKAPDEVSSAVAKAYGKFLNDPKVLVTILDRSERLPAVIYGAVGTQQRFKLLREVRLAEIIVLSGGFTSEASGRIEVLRQPRASCADSAEEQIAGGREVGSSLLYSIAIEDLIAGKADANLAVRYGDVITVDESVPVYVMGGVANPTRISFRDGLSLARAVASAGGLSEGADAGSVSIIRRGGAGEGVVKADLAAIESGTADDINLVPYDIIVVAQKGGRERGVAPIPGPDGRARALTDSLPMRIID